MTCEVHEKTTNNLRKKDNNVRENHYKIDRSGAQS